jgi:hypothetical protein
MSVSSLTTIAAARAEASTPARKPKKGELGKVPRDHAEANADATITDVLAKQIPTELLVPYTALTAAIVGAVAKPTSKKPNPDELAGWRWAAFVVLIASVIVMVWVGKKQKSGSWGFPYVTVAAAVLTAAAWAFLMPGSPLVPYLDSKNANTFVPLFVAIGGVVVAAFTAALLTREPKRSP